MAEHSSERTRKQLPGAVPFCRVPKEAGDMHFVAGAMHHTLRLLGEPACPFECRQYSSCPIHWKSVLQAELRCYRGTDSIAAT